jgi:hypothetical protein
MGSWIRCKCNQLVHKNLFCGTGISLLVTEDFLDVERSNTTAEELTSEIVLSSELLLKCTNCGRIMLLKETKDVSEVRFFSPDND